MRSLVKELNIGPFRETAFAPGHNACPGCGSTMALRAVLNAIGSHAICFVPASCASLYCAPSDTSATDVPVIHTVFAGAFAEAEGMAHALRLQGRDEKVIVWAGDGCCYDIALGGLSGAAARGANILVFCNDNEGYQNTGGHESTATPPDAATRTGRRTERTHGIRRRKDLVEIMAAHHVPYVATASAAYPDDLQAKIRKAAGLEGFRMILLLTPCVTWGYESRNSVKLARLAVETGYFPLYEVEHGVHYRITHEPAMIPLEKFTRLQRRFNGGDIELLREEIGEKWAQLRYLCARHRGQPDREGAPGAPSLPPASRRQTGAL